MLICHICPNLRTVHIPIHYYIYSFPNQCKSRLSDVIKNTWVSKTIKIKINIDLSSSEKNWSLIFLARYHSNIIWASRWENLSSEVCEHRRRPACPRSLISVFVIRFLTNIIYKLATSELSIFYLVPVAEETCLSLSYFGYPEDRFSRDEGKFYYSLMTLT